MSKGQVNLSQPVFPLLGTGANMCHDPALAVDDTGNQFEFASNATNAVSKKTRAIIVINTGSEKVRLGFDKNGSEITYGDAARSLSNPTGSWNAELEPAGDAQGRDVLSVSAEVSKIGARTDAALATTLSVLLI